MRTATAELSGGGAWRRREHLCGLQGISIFYFCFAERLMVTRES